MQVWDAAGDHMPALPDPDPTCLAERGRGLLLTEALSSQWGAYRSAEAGKVVWASCS